MRVLIDTNVALTFLSGREDPFSQAAEQIMLMCAREEIEGSIAFHSLSTIWYQARKLPDATRREWIRQLCELLTVSGADNEAVLAAIEDIKFKDFEDALQDRCAESFRADYIITANIKDFRNHSMTKPVTPDEFLAIMKK